MQAINASDYTVAELKRWLGQLELPTSGSKATLAARISEVPMVIRGEKPTMADPENSDEINGDENAMQSQDENEDTKNAMQSQDENEDNNNAVQRLDENEGAVGTVRQSQNENHRNNNSGMQSAGENLNSNAVGTQIVHSFDEGAEEKENDNDSAEVQLLKLKMKLIKLENEVLKKKQKESNNGGNNMMLSVIKDMLPEFDGKSSATIWVAQLKSIVAIYKLDDNMLRMLVMMKLTSDAQKWMYSNSTHTVMPIDMLLNKLQDVFHVKKNTMMIRRKFEERKWLANEDFSTFYQQKMLLAAEIELSKEELIDNLIEGIPEESLRRQAHMHCFRNPDQLLQAFEKITLPRKSAVGKKNVNPEWKAAQHCYNCNGLGHFANECRKPKREYGTCYGCGSTDHHIATCSEHKKKVKNDYNASSTREAQ